MLAQKQRLEHNKKASSLQESFCSSTTKQRHTQATKQTGFVWRGLSFFCALWLVGSLVWGCRPEEAQIPAVSSPDVLAVVGPHVITKKALHEAIKEQSAVYQRLFSTLPQKRALLQELMIAKLLTLEAQRIGLSNDPMVLRVRRRAALMLLTKQLQQVWRAEQSQHKKRDSKVTRKDFPAFYRAWINKQRKETSIRIEQQRWNKLRQRLLARAAKSAPLRLVEPRQPAVVPKRPRPLPQQTKVLDASKPSTRATAIPSKSFASKDVPQATSSSRPTSSLLGRLVPSATSRPSASMPTSRRSR